MRLLLKNMPVTFGRSATMLLLTPAGARLTGCGVPKFVPSKLDRHNVPSVHAVYNAPESMNAPRAWPHAVPPNGNVTLDPTVDPSKGRSIARSSIGFGSAVAPHAPTVFATVPNR